MAPHDLRRGFALACAGAIGLIGVLAAAACVGTEGLSEPAPAPPDADPFDADAPVDAFVPGDAGSDAIVVDAGEDADLDAAADSGACPSGTPASVKRSPGTIQSLAQVSLSGGGSMTVPDAAAWATPNRARLSDDSWAQVSLSATEQVPEWLVATNFGFAIPAGATIKGIRLDVERHAGAAAKIKDLDVRILKGGNALGVQKAKNDFFPTSDNDIQFGGPTDLWTATWTAGLVNETGFGVAFAPYFSAASGSDIAYVDQLAVVVFYDCP